MDTQNIYTLSYQKRCPNGEGEIIENYLTELFKEISLKT
jgi:hypothetical protein